MNKDISPSMQDGRRESCTTICYTAVEKIAHYRGLLLIESVIEGSRFDDLDATERVQRK